MTRDTRSHRQRIIDAASRQFRQDGVAAVGIAGIMADAGLTNGAFYTHFESKEDLVRPCSPARSASREATLVLPRRAARGWKPRSATNLSARHRDNPGRGCPTAALVAEIARHPRSTRDAFTDKVSNSSD